MLLGLALLAMAGPAKAEEIPASGSYAYGFPITGGEGAEFRAAPVPLSVYRSVTDPGLRDLGVYNAAGEAVPRIVVSPADEPPPAEQEFVLGLVPLYGPAAEQGEQLRLLMKQDASGTRLSLDAGGPGAKADSEAGGKTAPVLAAYIVDLREPEPGTGHGPEPEALRFNWDAEASGFIGAVRVETSSNLQDWQEVTHGTLADLSWEDTRIRQDRLELAPDLGDYLRITWSGLPPEWTLQSLAGISRGDGPAPRRDWIELEPSTIDEPRREFGFDFGAFAPVDRINLLLPDDNVVLRARILYRLDETDTWRLAHEGVFYHLTRQDRSVQSPPVNLGPVRARDWQVQIESGSAGGALQLQLGWQRERLMFLAQGEGPFQLSTGRALDRLDDFPQQRLMGDRALFRMLEDAGQPGYADLGERQTVAGEAALVIGKTVAWRTWLLWAGLTGAVLLVGWLAHSLWRDMQSGATVGSKRS